MNTVAQAIENMEYLRSLLRQKQPGFAALLELAVSQLEKKTPRAGHSTAESLPCLLSRRGWAGH
jgi:hypothetical protein